jgi:hypothetical protein
MLAQYEPAVSCKQLRTELFGNETLLIADSERRDKNQLRVALADRAPAFAYAAYSIGLDLVQEKVSRCAAYSCLVTLDGV